MQDPIVLGPYYPELPSNMIDGYSLNWGVL